MSDGEVLVSVLDRLFYVHPCTMGIGQLMIPNGSHDANVSDVFDTSFMWNNLTRVLFGLAGSKSSGNNRSISYKGGWIAECNDTGYVFPVEENDSNNNESFFDIYYSQSRFICETTIALMAVLANILAVVMTLCRRHGNLTVHHILFLNLGVANMISCVLAWLSNNVLYLFEHRFMSLLLHEMNLCKFFVYLSAGVFVSSATALVSTATVMGFITVQYIAICKPLEQPVLVRKNKVCIFILSTWIVTFTLGCVPFGVLLLLIHYKSCSAIFLQNSIKVVLACVDYHVTLVGLIDITAIFMCARIYYEIRQLHKRLSHFRFEEDMGEHQRKFITSVLLLTIMTLFLLPYTLLYVVTLNMKDTVDLHDNVLVYYMNLFPHLKFLSDPVVYGLRMREIRCLLLKLWCWSQSCCACVMGRSSSARKTSYTPCNTASNGSSTFVSASTSL